MNTVRNNYFIHYQNKLENNNQIINNWYIIFKIVIENIEFVCKIYNEIYKKYWKYIDILIY